jgi:hypothetical protein
MPEYTDTKSYAAFKDGYNAGLARDEESQYRILSRAENALYEDCKRYDNKSSKDIDYFEPPKVKASNTDELFILYKNDVEFTNSFREQVLQDERNYFESKYSKIVYKYLLDKRIRYNQVKDNYVNTDISSCTSSHRVDISGGRIIDKEYCESSLKSLYNRLTQFYPSIASATTYRKIEYRDAEHQLLMTLSNFINIIYYVLLFIMVILLASSNRLLIKDRFLIYLLLVLLPLLYPYIYDFCKKIFMSIFSSKASHGPKNAFVELPPPDINTYDI